MGLRLWSYVNAAFVGSILFFDLCYSEKAPNYSFVHEGTTAPPSSFYDYIVVGGGTAGCAIAATLSESARVLVLERGGSPYGNPNVESVAGFANNIANITPASPSQTFVSEDGVYNQRARVLGGGSAINAGFFSRASAEDVGRAGWERERVRRAYEWVEEKVAFRPALGPWQAAVKEGLLEGGMLPDNGFSYEHIPGTKIGGSIFDENGRRHTAADLLEYADPTRISVYLHATVQKILFKRFGNPRPRANGVVFKDALGHVHLAFLNAGPSNEIIVSAGAMGSPQLLMLSGIGPIEQLLAHGIHVVLAQPMVGRNMADNPMNAILVPSPRPVEISLIQTVGIPQTDGFYVEASSGLTFGRIGPNFTTGAFQAGNPPKPLAGQKTVNAVAGATGALNSSLLALVLQGGILLEKVSDPLSTGFLRLRSRDPEQTPAVTFNYFQHPEDLRQCVAGMTVVTDLVRSQAFSEFRFPDATPEALLGLIAAVPVNLRPRSPGAAVSLEKFCLETVLTIWHYHGGCRAGEVVDGAYRVMGVDALRVVDGSTFLKSPGTNPQATVMMLGRYVGEMMLMERTASMPRNR